METRPLVEDALAHGRYVTVVTYHDGPVAIRADLLFKEDARACAEVLNAASVAVVR